MSKKTHKVLDIAMHDKDGVYAGTEAECNEWAAEQGFGYRVVPLTKEEFDYENDTINYN